MRIIVIMIMRQLILLVVFWSVIMGVYSQKTLVLEKIGTQTRFGYHPGDDIKIRTIDKNLLLHNYMWGLTDSTVTIGARTTISLPDIAVIYRHYYFPRLMTRILFYAGAGYFVVDSFNNLINHEKVFVPQTLIISASLIGVSLAFFPLHQRKCKIGIRWKVKIMDITLN